MKWKIITTLAITFLAASVWLITQNRTTISHSLAELESARTTVALRSRQHADIQIENEKLRQKLTVLSEETERLQVESVDIENQIVQTESETTALKTRVTSALARIENAYDADDLNYVRSLKKEIEQLEKEIDFVEIETAKLEGSKAAYEIENAGLEKVVVDLKTLRQNQEAGVITGEFTATVAKAYNRWGFVIIDSGNDQGVVKNAQLDVFRDRQYIARLLVTDVGDNQSAADIVPGTSQPILPGDIIIPSLKDTSI